MSDSNAPRTVNRRKLLQGAGAAAAIPVIGGGAYAAYAQATPQAVVDATPVASPAAGTSGDWATFGYDYGQTRHVPFTGITKENVGELGIAWSLDFLAEDESIPPANQSYPIVIDGVVYVTTTFNHVFALDAKTGDIKWHWAPENIGFFKNFGVSANRGVAVGDGSVFIMTLDMHIYKLDQATGEQQQVLQIWDVVPESKPEFGYYESTAPVYYNGVLYFGVSGSDNGVRGWFMAINGSDMSPAWPSPYYTVPPDGQDWRAEGQNHGGGAPWMPASIDTETNILYFVTGNPSPDFFGEVRPGNNPNTNSMIALDASTGEQIWVAQSLTRDLWDYDMAAPPILFTATIAGAPRKVVAEGSKAGQWWCWDAATGEVIYDGVPFAKIDHPDPTAEGVLVYPGILGGSNYAPQSYDPTTNNYLICNIEWPSIVSTADPETVERRGRGDIDYGGTAIFSTDVKPYGTYVAISMENGEIVYSKETPGILRGGFTTTATGLGFYGGTTYEDSNLHAIDTATGDDLWTFGVGDSVQAAPSIYELDGETYVAVTVGGTSSKIIAFKLGGDTTQLPAPEPPAAASLVAPTDPAQFLLLHPEKADTVVFNAIANMGDANGGLNFNGWAKGEAKLTVPTGWAFTVNLWNQGVMPHSAMIVTADQVTKATDFVAAFQGGYTPDPTVGFTGDQVQHFVAVEAARLQLQPAGDYAFICAVPGHSPAGMWLTLTVDDAATSATLTAPDGTVYEAAAGTVETSEATPGASPEPAHVH
jgi:PQQ-dependent dehydrogenase (methanol/ethanol family)